MENVIKSQSVQADVVETEQSQNEYSKAREKQHLKTDNSQVQAFSVSFCLPKESLGYYTAQKRKNNRKMKRKSMIVTRAGESESGHFWGFRSRSRQKLADSDS